ncbi:EamA family transporter [Candidatus Saccharibacteria bacterium]|nr:EamA family transporter [Candidatus Saccharibacteria bacterium]
MTRLEKRGTLLVLSTAFISGFSIFANKFGVSGFDPYLFAWLKNASVAFLLGALLLGSGNIGKLKALNVKQWGLLALIGLVGGSIPFLLFFKGLSLTSAASASFIHKTMFVYVAFLAAVFLGEKLNARVLAAGLALLLGNVLFLKVLRLSLGTGDVLVFLATLLWAVENVISKYALRELASSVVAFGRMAFGSVFILSFLLFGGYLNGIADLTTAHWVWVLVTSAFLFGYVSTWYAGLKHVKATVATSVLLLGGPVTAFLAFATTSALPDIGQVLGIMLLVLGVITIGRVYELVRPSAGY